MTAITLRGKLYQGKVELASPIDLPDGSEVYIVAQVGIEQAVAQRKANGWLVDHVGNLVMADDGALVQRDERWIWRFHAYLTSLSHAPVGPIGEVEVDATTGELLNDANTIEKMYARGEQLMGIPSSSASIILSLRTVTVSLRAPRWLWPTWALCVHNLILRMRS